MANNRDSSKQQRSKQNRAQRAALEARTKSASEPAASRRQGTSTTGSKAKSGFFSGAREARGPRPGDVPVDIETLQGGWFSKRVQVPGGRQVLTGAVLTLVLSVMMTFQKFPPAGDPKAEATETLFDLFGTSAWLILGMPILIMAFVSEKILSPQRRRIWIAASFLIAIEVVFGMLQYLFPVGFLTYAVWRAAKVEGPAPSWRAMRAADKADEADGPNS